MILTFKSRLAREVFDGDGGVLSRRLPVEIRRAATRKLQYLNGATKIADMGSPPGNRLEALRGDLRGYHSIRVNDRWRIIFRFHDGNASDVDIVDYH